MFNEVDKLVSDLEVLFSFTVKWSYTDSYRVLLKQDTVVIEYR